MARQIKNNQEELSKIKGAIHDYPSSRIMPPGLDDAPSPEQRETINQKQIPLKDISKQPDNQPQQQREVSPTYSPIQRPEPSTERASYDAIEEIAESIIGEKWGDLVKGVGDLKLWKEKIDTDLLGIKQEIIRVQKRFENLQNSVTGKVAEYGNGMTEISSEIRALEKVLEKIISPLTTNVKELQKVADRLKK
jgi:hypothetical protein